MLPFAVQKVFNTRAESTKVVDITDNLNTPIIPEVFDLIVDSYSRSGSFYLNIEITGDLHDAVLTTSKVNLIMSAFVFAIFSNSKFCFSQALETFLIQENATEILHESKTTGELTQCTRRKLINRLHDYLKETYGDKSALAKATITLFPCLKTNESAIGGIVSSNIPNIAQYELQM